MPGYKITDYLQAVAFPAMYSVATFLLSYRIGNKLIILYQAVGSLLYIDTKKGIL